MAKKESIFLTLILGAQFFFLLIIYKSGFSGASGDDFFRALITYEWKYDPFLFSTAFGAMSVLWFPTHFWITGSLYTLTENLIFSMVSTSIIANILGLIFLFFLAKILFNSITAFLTLLLVAFLPWQIWLSLSMTEMIYYCAALIGAFLFFLLWQKEERFSWLVTTSLFFLIATMFRPEGWIFAGLFTLWILLDYFRKKDNRPLSLKTTVLAVTLSLLFIFVWLLHNWMEYGAPVYFLKFSKTIIQTHLGLHGMAAQIKNLQYPFLMFLISPPLFLITLLSLFFSFKTFNPDQKKYLYLVLSQLLLMMIASVYGVGTKAAPQRYVLINVVLLAPFAAFFLSQLWEKKYGKNLLIGMVSILLLINCFKAFHFSSRYQNTANVGKYLKTCFEQGQIRSEEQICSELTFRVLNKKMNLPEQEYLVLSSEHAALAAYSEKPGNFLFNIVKQRQKIIDQTALPLDTGTLSNLFEINQFLAKNQVTRIVLKDRELMELIPPGYVIEKMIGNYTVFARDRISFSAQEEDVKKRQYIAVKRSMGTGISLQGYRFEKGWFPDNLTLFWKMNEGFDFNKKYKLNISFQFIPNPEITFERHITPIFNLKAYAPREQPGIIEDSIPLYLPEKFPNGKYRLKIFFENMKDSKEKTFFEEIDLPPIFLIYSKREVLKDIISRGRWDLDLLAKTLITL
ncbi:MAG: glycosyltransferase family 39 protein [Deltaproteobacteria bacterium]|nr:glycosyltransferase family 39 protein [Deltaproteobacteria bacterium]